MRVYRTTIDCTHSMENNRGVRSGKVVYVHKAISQKGGDILKAFHGQPSINCETHVCVCVSDGVLAELIFFF